MNRTTFGNLWSRECGYRHVLVMAFPLIMSTGAWTVQHFVDRMFLSWYSADALAASLPAGMTFFTVASLFLGTVTYANTFVAQYVGAKKENRVGASIWQAMYLAMFAGLVLGSLYFLAEPLFNKVNHGPDITPLEIEYFRISCFGGIVMLIAPACSCFYSGRGKTWPIMWVNVLATALNLFLDYLWVFGYGGFPEMGIKGAAWATVASHAFSALLFIALLMQKEHRNRFGTLSGWRFDSDLFKRMIKFGLPAGFHFMVDMLSFTIVVLMIGRLGSLELAVTNMAFQINMLAFMPMIGFSITTSTLVGQNLGNNRPDLAVRATWSTYTMTFIYMFIIAMGYLFIPQVFIKPFGFNADPEDFAKMIPLAVVLMRFMAFYSLFDTMNLIFSSAVKGAGDTRYVLWVSFGLSWIMFVIPSYIVMNFLDKGIYTVWAIMTLYICVLGLVFLARFLGGKWKSMRVIEHPSPVVPVPEIPTAGVDIPE